MHNKIVGKKGENIAKEFLEKQGFKILELNTKFSRFCEIDIIAQEKNVLVFVEVKTRKTFNCGNPSEAVTKTKFNNIRQGAFLYMQEHQGFKKYRIDVISIVLEPEIKIEHLKNVSLC